jgi:hypothetical protein
VSLDRIVSNRKEVILNRRPQLVFETAATFLSFGCVRQTASVLLFVTLLSGAAFAQGSYLSYSTYLGGDGEDIVHTVATDSAGNVYLAGETTSSNFPVTAGAFQTKRGNSPGTIFGFESQFLPNGFVAKLSPAGQILWATYLGGSAADAALGIAVDAKGSPYVLGATAIHRTSPQLREPTRLVLLSRTGPSSPNSPPTDRRLRIQRF